MGLDSMAKEKLAVAKKKANRKSRKKVEKVKKAYAKKLRLHRKIGVAMGVGGTGVVLCAAMMMFFPVAEYVKGRIALERKDYEEAEQWFAQCGNFLNSEECRQVAMCCAEGLAKKH